MDPALLNDTVKNLEHDRAKENRTIRRHPVKMLVPAD
jgi:hypothetical protein